MIRSGNMWVSGWCSGIALCNIFNGNWGGAVACLTFAILNYVLATKD